MMNRWPTWGTIAAVMLFAPGLAMGLTDAEKCEATKLKVAGKYNFCRSKAAAKAVKGGDLPDYSKCDVKFGQKWLDAETKGAGMCPTTGDVTQVQTHVTADSDVIALMLTGVFTVDSDDGTVTDAATGLMWEKKDDLGGVHDKDNTYTWSDSGTTPDGTAFTFFLAILNEGKTDAAGITVSGCFANHCDWRLPTSAELQTILLAQCGTGPCIDPSFGPTSETYWTGTTIVSTPADVFAWIVGFSDGGFMFATPKTGATHVRAVRTAW